jgi:DNA-directed RNA polymerase specialized sigma24 family protein
MIKAQPKVAKKKYLSNKDLYCELIVSNAKGKLTREAERMLILLAKNVIKKMYYRDSDDKLDCLQTAYLNVFQNWYNFDENKSDNSFSYFTEIIKRGLAQGWNQQKRKKGDPDAIVISLTGYTSDGEQFERF